MKLHMYGVETVREGMRATDGVSTPRHGMKTSALF